MRIAKVRLKYRDAAYPIANGLCSILSACPPCDRNSQSRSNGSQVFAPQFFKHIGGQSFRFAQFGEFIQQVVYGQMLFFLP